MPCAGPDEPSDKEQNRVDAAKLLVYVYGRMNWRVTLWLQNRAEDMYGGGDDQAIMELCKVLESMSPGQLAAIVYDSHNRTARKLADWWEDHLETDERRIRREREARAKTSLLETARAKLTPAEWKALKGPKC